MAHAPRGDLTSQSAPRPAVPAPLTSLLGRDQETATLRQLLRRPVVRLITLPMIRAMFKGELSPQNTSSPDANTITGMPGSAGVVRGRARVVHCLAEAVKLQPGDVLVTESTEPPWTPLFATAGAIVTDTGGVLSHSAVVAHEYRIPAVVGTGYATSTFHDGQWLEVDGGAGTVRLVVEEAAPEHPLAG
jgi:phosphohistidine swiveling domain-containing protein